MFVDEMARWVKDGCGWMGKGCGWMGKENRPIMERILSLTDWKARGNFGLSF